MRRSSPASRSCGRTPRRTSGFSEREARYRADGEHALAEGAHRYALWCLRAYRAELDDPRPKEAA